MHGSSLHYGTLFFSPFFLCRSVGQLSSLCVRFCILFNSFSRLSLCSICSHLHEQKPTDMYGVEKKRRRETREHTIIMRWNVCGSWEMHYLRFDSYNKHRTHTQMKNGNSYFIIYYCSFRYFSFVPNSLWTFALSLSCRVLQFIAAYTIVCGVCSNTGWIYLPGSRSTNPISYSSEILVVRLSYFRKPIIIWLAKQFSGPHICIICI